MTTNPNNSVGTNGAFGGRTSVNALNDVLQTFNGAGILSGWRCAPSSGMTVEVGGQDTTIRDVAIAEDPFGNRTTIDNILSAPIEVTLNAASASSNRYTSIIAYVNSPTNASDTTLDNPTVVGLIAVDGTATTNPTKPTDAQIRTAITTDGGTGSAAYYVKLADIYVEAGLTTITADYIVQEELETAPSSVMQAKPYANGSNYSYTTTATSADITLQTLTIPEDGVYFVFCDGWMDENGKNHPSNIYPNVALRRNGTRVAYSQIQLISGSADTNEQQDLDVMSLLPLSAGDVIRVTFAQGGSNTAGMIYTYNFGMFKVSS